MKNQFLPFFPFAKVVPHNPHAHKILSIIYNYKTSSKIASVFGVVVIYEHIKVLCFIVKIRRSN